MENENELPSVDSTIHIKTGNKMLAKRSQDYKSNKMNQPYYSGEHSIQGPMKHVFTTNQWRTFNNPNALSFSDDSLRASVE